MMFFLRWLRDKQVFALFIIFCIFTAAKRLLDIWHSCLAALRPTFTSRCWRLDVVWKITFLNESWNSFLARKPGKCHGPGFTTSIEPCFTKSCSYKQIINPLFKTFPTIGNLIRELFLFIIWYFVKIKAFHKVLYLH